VFGAHFILNPRARVLWALRRALDRADGLGDPVPALAAAVRASGAAELATVVEHPFFLLWSAAMANLDRHEVAPPDWLVGTGLHGVLACRGVVALSAPPVSPDGRAYLPGPGGGVLAQTLGTNAFVPLSWSGPEGLLLLGDSELLRVLIGDHPSPVARGPERWAPRLVRALAFLREVSPGQHERLLAYVRFVASFDEPPGMLQSLSAGEFPGFVLARLDNGPAEVGDQLVHEATHQFFDRYLAERPEFVTALRAAPAAYSPFFQQPRPALKLLHGVVSYLEVLRFWQAVVEQGHFGADLDAGSAVARLEHIRRLCVDGCRSLRAAASRARWAEWSEHLVALCPAFTPLRSEIERRAVLDHPREAVEGLTWATVTERAELLLALGGHKVSRLSVSLVDGAELARSLAPAVVPLFARRVWVTRPERLKGSFNNLAEGTFEYYRPPPGATVFAYVGIDPEAAHEAVLADEDDAAGDLLGIPPCCCEHYAKHWDAARDRHEGDLLAWMLHEGEAPPREGWLPWQVNAFALYLGSGLTFHFPCSWHCRATIDRVDARAQALDRLDAKLAASLRAAQRRPVVWSPDGGVMAADLDPEEADVVRLEGASAPAWSDAMRRVRDEGHLRYAGAVWQTGRGEPLEQRLGRGARVLRWQ